MLIAQLPCLVLLQIAMQRWTLIKGILWCSTKEKIYTIQYRLYVYTNILYYVAQFMRGNKIFMKHSSLFWFTVNFNFRKFSLIIFRTKSLRGLKISHLVGFWPCFWKNWLDILGMQGGIHLKIFFLIKVLKKCKYWEKRDKIKNFE